MKKIALTLAAVAALGVAACSGNTGDAGNNATDYNMTANETDIDTNLSVNEASAVDATNNALDATGNAASDVGNTLGNAASDVGNAASGAANAVDNAI
jgi:hypothetical protein